MYMSAIDPAGPAPSLVRQQPSTAWIAVAGEIHAWNGRLVTRPGDRLAHQTEAVCAALAAC